MKKLSTVLSIFLLIPLYGQQKLKNYYPKEIRAIDLSPQKEKEINRQNELLGKSNLNPNEQKELTRLLNKYGENVLNSWDIIHGGCSWYCSGGNYAVEASSSLANNNEIDYTAQNANDLSYKTAWVEGVKDAGIGEYLEYFFKNESPRVTKIIISNGYVKSETAWKNNNRVKKFKLYVNGKVWGILNLKDSRTDQVFEVGTLGHDRNGADLVLKFEIMEVYNGDKFNDTAVSEIYFDGLDVH